MEVLHPRSVFVSHILRSYKSYLVVESAELVVFIRPNMTARYFIYKKQQNDADDERPNCAGSGCCELVAHLDPVAIPPTTCILVVDTVQR
jgi:hypothetical protein